MAPPAKRRKRNLGRDLDDTTDDQAAADDGPSQATTAATTTRGSLRRLLVSSSPTSDPSAVSTRSNPSSAPLSARSPSPTRKKSIRSSTTAAALSSRLGHQSTTKRNDSSTSAKAPSASPEKRRLTRLQAKKPASSEQKGAKTADLATLFTRQAQRNTAAAKETGAGARDQAKTATILDEIISDPISEDDEVSLKRTAKSSVVGRNAQKRLSKPDGSSQPPSSSLPTSSAAQRFLASSKQPSAADSLAVINNNNSLPGSSSNASSAAPDSRPWSERFAPVSLDELAVHKRKVADVRRWLDDVFAGRMRQRLLVLKGPAGSGKTTTVGLLAGDMGCEVLEWRNPISSFTGGGPQGGYQSAASQFDEFLGRGGKFGQLDLEEEDEDEDDNNDGRTPAHFQPASSSSAAATGAGGGSGRRLMLIEEFPNTFMRSSTALTSFRNTIMQFLTSNTPPLSLSGFGQQQPPDRITPVVMVISETLLTTTSASADSFTAHRLLGPEILRHPGACVIEFNPLAPTLLAKALELLVLKEARKSGRRRTPGPLVLRRLGEVGDIRNAVASLEFLCVKGDDASADYWGSKVAFTKPKRGGKAVPGLTKGEAQSLELISQREASLGIFHAVGKVVYNKRDDQPRPAGSDEALAEASFPGHMAHLARPRRSQVAVDKLVDETGTDPPTFIAALHENYALSCEPSRPRDPNSAMDYLNDCLDCLSDADLLCPSFDIFFGGRGGSSAFAAASAAGGRFDTGSHVLRQDEMAMQVAVRGLLFSLPCPVKRSRHPTDGRGGGPSNDAFKMRYPTSIKLWRAKEELEGLVDMWATKMLEGEKTKPDSTAFSGASAFLRNKSLADSAGNVNHARLPSRQGHMAHPAHPPPPPPIQSSQQPTQQAAPPPLLSLGTSVRQEMVLERLPYMALMARRRRRPPLPSVSLSDLDRVVSFRLGDRAADPGHDNDDDSEGGSEENSDEVTVANDAGSGAGAWATDRPGEDADVPGRRKGRGLGSILSRGRRKGGDGGADDLMGGGGGLPGSNMLSIQSLVISDDDIED